MCRLREYVHGCSETSGWWTSPKMSSSLSYSSMFPGSGCAIPKASLKAWAEAHTPSKLMWANVSGGILAHRSLTGSPSRPVQSCGWIGAPVQMKRRASRYVHIHMGCDSCVSVQASRMQQRALCDRQCMTGYTRAFAMHPASPRMPCMSSIVGVGWRLPVHADPTLATSQHIYI